MILTNNWKAYQATVSKTEVDFNSILEQILNLYTQKKVSKSKSMKNTFKAIKTKKSTSQPYPPCLYYSKNRDIEKK